MKRTALVFALCAAFLAAGAAAAADKVGAHKDMARGMECEMWHGKGKPPGLNPPDIKK